MKSKPSQVCQCSQYQDPFTAPQNCPVTNTNCSTPQLPKSSPRTKLINTQPFSPLPPCISVTLAAGRPTFAHHSKPCWRRSHFRK